MKRRLPARARWIATSPLPLTATRLAWRELRRGPVDRPVGAKRTRPPVSHKLRPLR